MARSEFDAPKEAREIPADDSKHRSRVEIERFASSLEDFAISSMLVNVKAYYITTEGHRYTVEFENNGQPTDKPKIQEVDL